MISRNSWAVAACLIMLGGLAFGQTQGDNQQNNGQQKNTQSEEIKAGPSKSDVGLALTQPKAPDGSATQAKIYEPDCRKPKDQPEADLCTQRRVANAAEETLQYNFAQTVVGAVGVVLVVITIIFTARSNKAAVIAAKAAVDAVGSERAWMSFARIDLNMNGSPGPDKTFIIDGFIFELIWANDGRSPAINTVIYREYEIINNGSPMPDVKLQGDSGEFIAGVIGPGRSAMGSSIYINGKDKNDFENRKKI